MTAIIFEDRAGIRGVAEATDDGAFNTIYNGHYESIHETLAVVSRKTVYDPAEGSYDVVGAGTRDNLQPGDNIVLSGGQREATAAEKVRDVRNKLTHLPEVTVVL